MQAFYTLLIVLQVVSAIAIIGLVLIQHGKGADMGASFGSGASGSLFGASGSASFFSRATAVCAVVFFVATLGLSIVASGKKASGGTVLDSLPAATQPAAPAAPASVPAESQGTQIPK